MDFLQKPELYKLISETDLITITESDDTLLDQAESAAIEEMSNYLNIRYDHEVIFTATGADRNSMIMMYLSDIMLYHLHARISPDNIPDLRKERYEHAKDWLEKIADGFISPILPAKQEDESLPIRYGSSSEKQNHYY